MNEAHTARYFWVTILFIFSWEHGHSKWRLHFLVSFVIQCDQWDTSRNEVWQFPRIFLKRWPVYDLCFLSYFPFLHLAAQSTGMMTGTLVTILLFFAQNLFIWLHWVLVAAHGIFHCGMRAWQACGMWDFSSLTRDWTRTPCIGRQILNHWTTREVAVAVLDGGLLNFYVREK